LLIPNRGIAGAALAAALTNAASNILYLGTVRSALGLFPYNRSYLRLLVPFSGTLGAILILRFAFTAIHPQWMVVAIGLLLSYVIFFLLALASGLDEDDRLVARAVWSRLRGMVMPAEVKA
jgi:hypothetical protein